MTREQVRRDLTREIGAGAASAMTEVLGLRALAAKHAREHASVVQVLEAKEVYDAVMQSFPTTLGKSVSKKERDELGLKDASLVYGEITFETFAIVMEKIKKVYGLPFANSCGPAGMLQSRGGIFYDLGSGTGKPVIAAAICHNFDVCYGIEVLEGLYSMSLDAMNMYNTKGKARLAGRSTDTCKLTSG